MSNRRLRYPRGAFDQRSKGERRNEITIRYEEIAFVDYPVTHITRASILRRAA